METNQPIICEIIRVVGDTTVTERVTCEGTAATARVLFAAMREPSPEIEGMRGELQAALEPALGDPGRAYVWGSLLRTVGDVVRENAKIGKLAAVVNEHHRGAGLPGDNIIDVAIRLLTPSQS